MIVGEGEKVVVAWQVAGKPTPRPDEASLHSSVKNDGKWRCCSSKVNLHFVFRFPRRSNMELLNPMSKETIQMFLV